MNVVSREPATGSADAHAPKIRILILGGGFGGVYTARHLEQLCRRRLDVELAKVVASTDLRERFAAVGVEPAGRSAEQMAAYLKSEIDKYSKIVRAIGLKIE